MAKTAHQVVAATAVDDINLDDIHDLDTFVEKYPHLTSEPRMRWLIFNRRTNGLESSGAIIKRAGRWYVVTPRFKSWLLIGTSAEAA